MISLLHLLRGARFGGLARFPFRAFFIHGFPEPRVSRSKLRQDCVN